MLAEASQPRPSVRRSSQYLWFSLAISFTAFLGFSFTYFGPLMAGEYPDVAPAVHVHGWSFFLWYLLFPLQAGLIRFRRLATHRAVGFSSLALAAVMVGTGLLVLGTQMEAALQPGGSPFWRFLGLAILTSLLLFTGFYVAGLRARRRPRDHRRYMLLASAGGLGAATFRITGQLFGFNAASHVAGVLAPNLFIVAAVLVELRREGGIHRIYRIGLPASVLATVTALLITPTWLGRGGAEALAWIGRMLAPLY